MNLNSAFLSVHVSTAGFVGSEFKAHPIWGGLVPFLFSLSVRYNVIIILVLGNELLKKNILEGNEK